jgi:hypothetical protein
MKMEQDFERYNIHNLLELYLEESREFSSALESGVSWKQLQMLRDRIRRISELINKKYEQEYGGPQRVRYRPPTGE